MTSDDRDRGRPREDARDAGAPGAAGDVYRCRVLHAVGGIEDPTLRRATVEAVEAIAWLRSRPGRRPVDANASPVEPAGAGDGALLQDSVRLLTTFSSIADPHRRRLALAVLEALASPAGDASAHPAGAPGGSRPVPAGPPPHAHARNLQP